MTLIRGRAAIWVGLLAATVAACGGADAPSSGGQDTPQAPASAAQSAPSLANGVAIDFTSTPDPLEAGDNTIAVTLTQPDGSPVTDASVTAVFSMPAMPAMNMPAMRSEATLQHAGNGRYQGTGQLSMGGTWNVTITASRGSGQLGTRRLIIVAKE